MTVFLFDIDGTLLSSGGAGKAAMEAALCEQFGIPAITAHVDYGGRTDLAIMQDLLLEHGHEPSVANCRRLHAAYLGHLPRKLTHHQGRILPGVQEVLEELRTQELAALGLLTGNFREGARIKLGHYRINHHFAFGGFGDLHLCRNDVAREAASAASAHLSRTVEPDCVWVIGDTPLDIRCARAIGARAVAVATGWHSLEQLEAEKPDHLLPDLRHFAKLTLSG